MNSEIYKNILNSRKPFVIKEGAPDIGDTGYGNNMQYPILTLWGDYNSDKVYELRAISEYGVATWVELTDTSLNSLSEIQNINFNQNVSSDFTRGKLYWDTELDTLKLDISGGKSFVFLQATGNIHLHDGVTAQSIPTGSTYTKLTGFTDHGPSVFTKPDAENNKIILTKKGIYKVSIPISAFSGTANVTFSMAAFLDGVEQHQVHAYRKFAVANDNGFCMPDGLIMVDTVPIDLDVRAKHTSGSAVNLTLVYAGITVDYKGLNYVTTTTTTSTTTTSSTTTTTTT